MEPKPREFTPDEFVAIASQQAKMEGRKLDAARIAQEVKMRMWCIEQALSFVKYLPDDRKSGLVCLTPIAWEIFAWVTDPLYAKKEASGDAP